MLREDIRGICHRPCIYNDKDKCDMWDELSVPDGFYLVKDENDQWSTLSPSLYELIKDKVHGEK